MKGNVFVVHWNVQEAQKYAQHLYEDGWSVTMEAVDGRRAYDLIREGKPDVVVIYLSRLHIQGRALAKDLRESDETSTIPIVFVDGKEKAVTKAMEEVPDAIPTKQEDILGVLLRFRRRDSDLQGSSEMRITDIKTVRWGDVDEERDLE